MSRALIIGADGQDGQLLREQLATAGYQVALVGRQAWRFAGEEGPFRLSDPVGVKALLDRVQPSELYYLAACHHASEERGQQADQELWAGSLAVHVHGWQAVLEALPGPPGTCHAVYAASSRIFGQPAQAPQNESTPLNPRCIYGITKSMGLLMGRYYREQYGQRISTAILYNHESPLRRPAFASRKVISGLLRVARGEQAALTMANLAATVDWGYAPDYTRAMQLMARQSTGGEYVVATGVLHSIRDFATLVCRALGLDPGLVLQQAPSALPPAAPAIPLVGDASRLRRLTGWQPSVTFAEMVALLLRQEQERSAICRA